MGRQVCQAGQGSQREKSTGGPSIVMPSKLALLDTNILVYAFSRDSEKYQPSRSLLEQVKIGELEACLTSQVLAGFYSVVTDQRRFTIPQTPQKVLRAIEQILAMPSVTLLPQPTNTTSKWIALIKDYPAKSSAVFDVQLVATMITNNIHRIYTYNRSDFERFPQIEVITPG